MAIHLDSGPTVKRHSYQQNAEINITPFVDVILVLLIIFMVAAPLATVDVNVDLPGSTARPQERPDTPLYLTVESDLALSLGDQPVSYDTLAMYLDRETGGDRETRVFLRADRAVAYGDLMEVMNTLRSAGYLRIALVGMELSGGAPAAPAEGAP